MAAQAPLAWADATRDKGDGDKAGIVKALKVGAGDPATASHWWLIHYPDRNPLEVASYPKATHTEMLEQYPDAIAAEPFTPTVRQPFAPLSASEETAVRMWLALIEETDPAAIAEVLDQCNRDSDARIYFTGRAALDLLNAGFVTDATRIHRKQ